MLFRLLFWPFKFIFKLLFVVLFAAIFFGAGYFFALHKQTEREETRPSANAPKGMPERADALRDDLADLQKKWDDLRERGELDEKIQSLRDKIELESRRAPDAARKAWGELSNRARSLASEADRKGRDVFQNIESMNRILQKIPSLGNDSRADKPDRAGDGQEEPSEDSEPAGAKHTPEDGTI